MCDEFPCLSPTTALREWQQLPVGTLEDVIEARHYARLKALHDAATTPAAHEALPRSGLMDLVKVITYERAAAEIEARANGNS